MDVRAGDAPAPAPSAAAAEAQQQALPAPTAAGATPVPRELLAAMTTSSATAPDGSQAAGGVSAAPLPLAAQQQQAEAAASGVAPLPLPLAQSGANKLPVALPPQGPSGLPAGMVTPAGAEAGSAASAAAVSAAAAAVGLLGDSPETGLIAVSSTGSLASSAAASASTDTANKTLYLGNLHPFVTEATLQEVFAGLGGVAELKVIKDKATGVSAGYGFAKFTDQASAQAALDRVNKTVLFGQEARVNWAFQKELKEEVTHPFHVFVGDLSSDVTDAMLHSAFGACPGCSDARVMWDHATGRSRGYGFVSFARREEAEAAIQAMHGQFIGARRVRCGWAQHKTDGVMGQDPTLLDRADPTNTNVYVGNLAPVLTDVEVRRQFGAYGPIAEVKLYRKGSYGFVRYKSHSDAVRAIVGMNGQALGGKIIKCSWGRHPNTPPSGVQTSLMLAAAAGLPLAMGTAGMLGHSGMGGHNGMMGGGMGMMGGGMGMQGMSMQGMPMAAAAAQSLIHGGQAGMGGAGVVGQAPAAAMLNGSGNGGVLDVQGMAGMPYGMPYGGSAMHNNMAFFGGGGLN